jgi:hypothetical protein
MNNNLFQDKDANCFIVYFYFALFLYLLFLLGIWIGEYLDMHKTYSILWQFDEVLYVYLVWPFFSLLNLSYITIKNNKIKLYFSISLIIFLSLISTYFILSIENIYRLNFPDQFLSLYINSIIFVIAILLTFILFARIIFKNSFNKHNFILLNSFFFLIILFIAMLFIVINKPWSTLDLDNSYLPSFLFNLYEGALFLFIPFLTFLFLILIRFFKYQTILFVVITGLGFYDALLLFFMILFTSLYLISQIIMGSITFLFLFIWIYYFFKKGFHSPLRNVILFNIITMLLYSFLLMNTIIGVLDFHPPSPVTYKFDSVYNLSRFIGIIISFLLFVNLMVYIKGKLTLKALK